MGCGIIKRRGPERTKQAATSFRLVFEAPFFFFFPVWFGITLYKPSGFAQAELRCQACVRRDPGGTW